MARELLNRLWGVLNRPLFGTKVVPRTARVDPAAFPEDEFPVYCPKCEYLLRGLPEPVCPECGTSFHRGELLLWSTWIARVRRGSADLVFSRDAASGADRPKRAM